MGKLKIYLSKKLEMVFNVNELMKAVEKLRKNYFF